MRNRASLAATTCAAGVLTLLLGSAAGPSLAEARGWEAALLAGSGGGYPTLHRFAGEGQPARLVRLRAPAMAAPEGNGDVLIIDSLNRRVRRVSDGVVRTVAGSGRKGDCGDRIPARELCLAAPHSVWPDGRGGALIADTFNSKIRHVARSGMAKTLIGAGCQSESWDCRQEGDVASVRLALPTAIKPWPSGGYLITDAGSHRVLLWQGKHVKIVAGDGYPRLSGDGGPARSASLWEPQDAVEWRGGVLIADGGNCRVRWVDPQGTIRTLIGGALSAGECRQRIEKWLPAPQPLVATAPGEQIAVVAGVAAIDETIYLTNFLDGQVLSFDGSELRRVAGVGGTRRVKENSRPGQRLPLRGSAETINFVYPAGLSTCQDGRLLLGDPGNGRIWWLSPPGHKGGGRCR